jgi:O-antigen/teichoic acid export membrane protein
MQNGKLSLFFAVLNIIAMVAVISGHKFTPESVALSTFIGNGVAWLCLSKLERLEP